MPRENAAFFLCVNIARTSQRGVHRSKQIHAEDTMFADCMLETSGL